MGEMFTSAGDPLQRIQHAERERLKQENQQLRCALNIANADNQRMIESNAKLRAENANLEATIQRIIEVTPREDSGFAEA